MLLAVYGQMRLGLVGHARYLGDLKPLSVETIWGFSMYHTGDYPYIVRGPDKVTFEIYDLPMSVAARIIARESEKDFVADEMETEYGTATIFTYPMERHRYLERRNAMVYIQNGDWRRVQEEINPTSISINLEQNRLERLIREQAVEAELRPAYEVRMDSEDSEATWIGVDEAQVVEPRGLVGNVHYVDGENEISMQDLTQAEENSDDD